IEGRLAKQITWPPPAKQGAASKSARESPIPGFGGSPAPITATTFKTTLPAFVDPGLESFLIDNSVEISAIPIQSSSPWATLLYGFGPAIFLILFYVWLFRRAARQGGGLGGGLMGIGKSTARRYDQEAQTKVTFQDVAGIDEAENEL